MNAQIIKSIPIIWKVLIHIIVLNLIIHTLVGCKKLVETPIPTDQIAENAVYTADPSAISVLTALYSAMNTNPIQGGNGSISMYAGLSADEYKLTAPFASGKYLSYYQNSLSQTNPSLAFGAENWAPLYSYIFKCNAAIEGLYSSKANALSFTVKQRLIGESKFMRAFFYFYLVNEFGDVPLALTTDPQSITLLSRTPKLEVYDQVISDLLDAEEKLSNDYMDVTLLKATVERVRPNRWAATAMLSRVYLYKGEYANAEAKATAVINNNGQFSLLPLNNVFLKNSSEAIWQIQPTDLNINTREGQSLIIPSTGPANSGDIHNIISLSYRLLNSFEPLDQRFINGNWVKTTIYKTSPTTWDTVVYPFKYKVDASPGVKAISGLTEYFMVLRLAEQYLIRAEARAQQSNTTGAIADLDAIRNRAGLAVYSGSTAQAPLLSAILHERQVELFSEWGHRWFDLKRTGNVDKVMSSATPLKANGAAWQSYQQLYPLPMKDLQISPNLVQNAGY